MLLIFFAIDATVWKEAFEKAKKIVGSECEIYAGKNNTEEKHVESDSEPSSDVSYSESTDNEEQANKLTEGDLKVESNETEKVEPSEKQIKDGETMEKVAKELEQLQVKGVEEKK